MFNHIKEAAMWVISELLVQLDNKLDHRRHTHRPEIVAERNIGYLPVWSEYSKGSNTGQIVDSLSNVERVVENWVYQIALHRFHS